VALALIIDGACCAGREAHRAPDRQSVLHDRIWVPIDSP